MVAAAQAIGGLVLGFVGLAAIIKLGRIYRVPKIDEAIVITGFGIKKGAAKVLFGGGGVVLPMLQRTNPLSLKTFRISLIHENLISKNNVRVGVKATVYLKVPSEVESIITASQTFTELSEGEMSNFISKALEGHLRGIVATKTPEDINANLISVAEEVMNVSQPDIEKLGLTIKTFVVNEIINDEYFGNLAKPRETEVKRDAEIATAKNDKASRIESAKNLEEAVKQEQETAENVAEFKRNADVKREKMRDETLKEKAKADMSHQLETASLNRNLTERQQEVEIMKQEKEKEVKEKKAEAEGIYKVILATKEKEALIETAKANMEKKKLDGTAEKHFKKELALGIEEEGRAAGKAREYEGLGEAEAIKAKALAKAEGTDKMMEALAKMSEDAKQLEKLKLLAPELAKIVEKMAGPMAQMGDKVTYVNIGGNGDGNGIGGVAAKNLVTFAAVIPTILNQLGVDASRVFNVESQKTIDEGTKKAPEAGVEVE
jgi:flotillin